MTEHNMRKATGESRLRIEDGKIVQTLIIPNNNIKGIKTTLAVVGRVQATKPLGISQTSS